jgi:hypothetical protein
MLRIVIKDTKREPKSDSMNADLFYPNKETGVKLIKKAGAPYRGAQAMFSLKVKY